MAALAGTEYQRRVMQGIREPAHGWWRWVSGYASGWDVYRLPAGERDGWPAICRKLCLSGVLSMVQTQTNLEVCSPDGIGGSSWNEASEQSNSMIVLWNIMVADMTRTPTLCQWPGPCFFFREGGSICKGGHVSSFEGGVH